MTTDAQRSALEEANKDPKGLVAQLFSAITMQEKLAGLSSSAEDKMSKSNPNVIDTIVEKLEAAGAIGADGKIDETKAKPVLEELETENKTKLDGAIAEVDKAAQKDPKLAARISELKQVTEEEMALTSKAAKGSPEYQAEYDKRLRGHYQAALEYQGSTVEAGNPPRNLSTAEAFAAEAEGSKLRLQAAKTAQQKQEETGKQAGADDKKGDGGKKEGEEKDGPGNMLSMLGNLLSSPAGMLVAIFVMLAALSGKAGEGLMGMLGMGGGQKDREPGAAPAGQAPAPQQNIVKKETLEKAGEQGLTVHVQGKSTEIDPATGMRKDDPGGKVNVRLGEDGKVLGISYTKSARTENGYTQITGQEIVPEGIKLIADEKGNIDVSKIYEVPGMGKAIDAAQEKQAMAARSVNPEEQKKMAALAAKAAVPSIPGQGKAAEAQIPTLAALPAEAKGNMAQPTTSVAMGGGK